jgi:Flp pilus assembly protein TadB
VNTVIHVTERNAFNAVIHREPDIKLSNVLPGSKVKLTRSWDNDPYVKGSITVQITTGTATSATRSVNFWSVSWRTFVVPVALVVVLFVIRWRIRRHRRERDARELAELNPNGPSSNGSHSNGSRGSRKPAPEPAPS